MFDKSEKLVDFDPDLAVAIAKEEVRQEQHIELIASENYTSHHVMALQGSVLTNKYARAIRVSVITAAARTLTS